MKALIVFAVLKDVFSYFGISAEILGTLFAGWQQKRLEDGRNTLIDELRNGNIGELHVADEDEVFAIFWRYLIAVRDGVAKRNLRLLARTIVGLGLEQQLYVDEYDKFAKVIESLSREQIILLGCYYKNILAHENRGALREKAENDAWPETHKELIGSVFHSGADLQEYWYQCLGFGLFYGQSTVSDIALKPTALFYRIGKLARMDNVVDAKITP